MNRVHDCTQYNNSAHLLYTHTHTCALCLIETHLVLVQIVSQVSSASDDFKKEKKKKSCEPHSLVHLNGQIKCT